MRLFAAPQRDQAPTRPSHFGEDQNERVDLEAAEDYPVELIPELMPEFPRHAPAPEPVPVYQVESPPRDRTIVDWQPATYSATTDPQQVASADRRRRRILVKNLDSTGGNLIYVAKSRESAKAITSYAVRGTAEVEMFHTQEVWVFSDTSTRDFSVMVEFEVDDV